MGGWDGSYLSSVEVLDLSNNQIDCQIPDMPYVIEYHQAVTVDGRPVFCGGEDESTRK